MNIKGFDFLDFGASKGVSIDFGKQAFFGKRGMGVDLDPERVEIMKRSGYDCMVGDLTDLDVPANCVRFVKMSHILEHMPDLKGVEKAIASAKKAATDFLVITGPFFDEDDYLQKLGLKLDWSDYPEHTCHLTIIDTMKILKNLGLTDYELYVRYPIYDSSSDRIHPLASPAGSHRYDPKQHPRKKQLAFDRIIWTDFVCYVRLKKDVSRWDDFTKAYKGQIPFAIASDGSVTITPTYALEAMATWSDTIQNMTAENSSLKHDNKQLQEHLQKTRQELAAILQSKAWKAINKLRAIARPSKRTKE